MMLLEKQSKLVVDNTTQRLLDLTAEKERQDADIEEIISIVKEKAPKLLDGFAKTTEKKIAQDLVLKTYARDEVIFLQNDYPDAYYTVMRGAVSIYALNSSTISKESLSHPHRRQYGKFLLQLPPGESFGELSFNADRNHSKRNAGVISDGNHGQSRVADGNSPHGIECSDVAVLLLIPEKTYMNLMFARHASRNQTKDKIAFLKASFLFNQWSMDQLVNMAYSMKKVLYEKGSKVADEGDRVDQVWIVRKGRIMVNITGKDSSKSSSVNIKFQRNSYAKQDIEIAELGSSDIFGLVEIISGHKKMKRTAIAITPLEVFLISSTKFSSFLIHEPKTAALLEKVVQRRIEWEDLRKDYAQKFPTMPLSLPVDAALMSKYSISRESVMSDQELKNRKDKNLVLCRYLSDARTLFRTSLARAKDDDRKASNEAMKKMKELAHKAFALAEKLNDQERKKQAAGLLNDSSTDEEI